MDFKTEGLLSFCDLGICTKTPIQPDGRFECCGSACDKRCGVVWWAEGLAVESVEGGEGGIE
jgi:hypothetical protein